MTRTDNHKDSVNVSPARVEDGSNKAVWPALLAGLITFAVFCPVLRHGFVDAWDDDIAITNNRDYNPPTLHKLLHYWVPPPHHQFYVPVTYTLLGLVAMVARSVTPDRTASFNPLPFHAINLGTHILSAVIVFLILRRLVAKPWAAFFGALVFALHPIQVEAVAWASSMYTPLCGMLGLAAVWQFLLYSDHRETANQHKARIHYVVATILFLLAILTKPAAASVPLIALAIEIGWLRRSWRTVALPLGLWVLLCVPIVLATTLANPPAIHAPEAWQKIIIAVDAMAFYLYKIMWPTKLCADYGRSPYWVLGHPMIWLACVVPIVLFFFIRQLHRPWLNAAAGVFMAGLLPTLGLANFDFQGFSTVADRFAYLPMLAIAMVAAMLVSRAALKVVLLPTLAAIIALGALSAAQLAHWQNVWTLFSHTIETNPESRIVAGDTRWLLTPRIEAHCTLSPAELARMADLLLQQKRSTVASDLYRLAMSRGAVPQSVHDNLALALFEDDKLREAQEACVEALRRDPTDAQAHTILGNVYLRTDPARAAEEYRRALRLDPGNLTAARGLAATGQ
jgi:tetratricopeptide (TPR) repeat protein